MPNETNVFSSPSAPLAMGVQSKPLGVISLLNPSGEVARRWRLQQPKCTIGSDRQATIWIDDPALSSFHALLVFGAGQTIVKCFSTGVRLNGNPIREASLQVHDRLEIGALTFLVEAIPGSSTTKIPTSETAPMSRAVDSAQLSSNAATNTSTSTQPYASHATASSSQASSTVTGGSASTGGSAKLEGQVETLLQRLSDIDSKISSTSAAQKLDFMLQCDSLRSESKQLRQALTEDLVQHIKKLSEDLDHRLETRDAQSNNRLNQITSEFQRFQSTFENRLEQLQSRNDSQVQSLQTNLGDLAAIVETQQPLNIQDLERRLNILETAIQELRTAVESREPTPLPTSSSALPKPLTEPFRSDGTHPHPSRRTYESASSNGVEAMNRDSSISPASHSYAAGFHATVDSEDEAIIGHANDEAYALSQRSNSDRQEYPPILDPLTDRSDVTPVDSEDFDTPSNLPSWFTDTTDSDPLDSAPLSSIRNHSEYGDGTADSLLSDSEESNSDIISDSWGDGLEEDIFSDGNHDHFSDDQLYGNTTDGPDDRTSFPSISALDILRASYAQSSESDEDESFDPNTPSHSLLGAKQQSSDLSSPSIEAMRTSQTSTLSQEKEPEATSSTGNDSATSASALLERLKREMVEQEEQELAANSPAKSSNSLRSPKDKSLQSVSESSVGAGLSKPASQHSSHSNSSHSNPSHSHSSSSASGSEPSADDDSVEAYMQKLLARMRGDSAEESKEATNSPASPKTVSTKSTLGKSTTSTNKVVRTTYSPMRKSRQDPAAALIASRPQVDATTEGTPVAEGVAADPNVSAEVQEGEASDNSIPRTAPEKSTDFRALRELANDSARTAIKSSENKIRPVGNIIKLSISVLASLFGIQLLYENGLQVNLTLVAAATAFMLAAIWCMDVIQSTQSAKKSEKKNGSNSQVQMKISGKR